MMDRRTGTVVRLLPEKGFGFILDAEDQTEYFFHRSAILDFMGLTLGVPVSFVALIDAPKGPRAEDVVRV